MEKPTIAGKVPHMYDLVLDKTYAWCACGESQNQPWCDGSHKGTEFAPKVFKAKEDKKVAMCMCKQSKKPPYCDGSHASV